MLERMEKGYQFLTKKEKFLVKKNAMNTYQVLATEWRLKRVNRNIGHYKQAFKNHMLFLDYKASRDWFKIWTESWKNQKPYPSKLDSSIILNFFKNAIINNLNASAISSSFISYKSGGSSFKAI